MVVDTDAGIDTAAPRTLADGVEGLDLSGTSWVSGSGAIRIRTATRYDQPLLRTIFADARSGGFAALPTELSGALLDIQYLAHQQSRQRLWPQARDQVIEHRGVPAGRITVDTGEHEIRITDLTLLPGFRGMGIATAVLLAAAATAEANGVPLRMTVDRSKMSADLLGRLQLREISSTDTDVELER